MLLLYYLHIIFRFIKASVMKQGQNEMMVKQEAEFLITFCLEGVFDDWQPETFLFQVLSFFGVGVRVRRMYEWNQNSKTCYFGEEWGSVEGHSPEREEMQKRKRKRMYLVVVVVRLYEPAKYKARG